MDKDSCHRALQGSVSSLEHRTFMGRPSSGERLEIGLHLRHRNPLPSLTDLCAPSWTPMERSDFAERHSAAQEDITKVEAFASRHGLEVVDRDPSHRLVTLSGRVHQLETAFQLDLIHAGYGTFPGAAPDRIHRTHLGPIHLPEDLIDCVQGVFGLDNRPTARSQARTLQAYSPGAKAFLPPQVAELYGFPEGDGRGQSVALIELSGGYLEADLQTYFEQLNLPMPKITDISVQGGQNNPRSGDTTEVYLDLEVLGSLIPSADIAVYFAPNQNFSFIQAVKQAIHDPERANSVISISWASPETQWTASALQAMNEALHEAAVLGVTVCVSSGDFGASSERHQTDGYAHVEFPASSPFALACGGTRLIASSDAIASEVVWNDASGASGGGASAIFAVPPYQAAAGVVQRTVNPGHRPGRGLPDVAGNADQSTGYVLRIFDQTQVVGGTSAVAPLWAALVARLNAQLGQPLGFLQPALYEIGAHGFHDVVCGNNANARWVGGYWAGPGWDACTGWGSPRGLALLNKLRSLKTRR